MRMIEEIKSMRDNITARDATVLARDINMAVEIQARHPAMNREGVYNLPPISMDLLSCDNHQCGRMTPETVQSDAEEVTKRVIIVPSFIDYERYKNLLNMLVYSLLVALT